MQQAEVVKSPKIVPAKYWVRVYFMRNDRKCEKESSFWASEDDLHRHWMFGLDFLRGAPMGLIQDGGHPFGDWLKIMKIPAHLTVVV